MNKNILFFTISFLILALSLIIGCKKEGGPKTPQEKFQVRHILVDSKETAEEVMKKLKKGEKFEKLAKEYSKCLSKMNGGMLETFEKGEKEKEFEDAVIKLKVGETSEPFETKLGWEIVQRLVIPTPTPTATPEAARVRHILVEKEEEAKEIVIELKKGGNFTEIAIKKSYCPTRAKGGDLGIINYNSQVSKELKEVIFKLKVGEISEPVKSSHGWHIIQKIKPGEKIELPEFEKIRIKHILVEKKEEAEEISKELKKGGDFYKLVQEKSICPSKIKGGDLGVFTIGALEKPLEDVAFKLKVGEISEPVESEFGWHIIQRIGIDDEVKVPPKEVRISHIIVENKEEANKIYEELKKGVEFDKLVKEKSKGPSKDKGGDLGIIEKGVLVKPLEDAAFSLEVGEISKPVEAPDGWHILKRTE